jgi:GNAT superfamily N-acetyltransferase
MSDLPLEIAADDPRSAEAALIHALSQELAQRYDFADDGSGNFKAEDVLGRRSAFLVGRVGNVAVACGAFRPLYQNVAEIKRMFVLPDHRGQGHSKTMLAELEQRARNDGYTTVRLETGDRQPEAIGLYEGCGYYRIPNYGFYADSDQSVCFEKQL